MPKSSNPEQSIRSSFMGCHLENICTLVRISTGTGCINSDQTKKRCAHPARELAGIAAHQGQPGGHLSLFRVSRKRFPARRLAIVTSIATAISTPADEGPETHSHYSSFCGFGHRDFWESAIDPKRPVCVGRNWPVSVRCDGQESTPAEPTLCCPTQTAAVDQSQCWLAPSAVRLVQS